MVRQGTSRKFRIHLNVISPSFAAPTAYEQRHAEQNPTQIQNENVRNHTAEPCVFFIIKVLCSPKEKPDAGLEPATSRLRACHSTD